MNEDKPCPIWGTPNNSTENYRGDGLYVDSPRAGGKYFVDGRAEILVGNLDVREKARLTTWMIEQRRLGVERPEVWSHENEIESKARRPDMTVHARADELLKYIQKMTRTLVRSMCLGRAKNLTMEWKCLPTRKASLTKNCDTC